MAFMRMRSPRRAPPPRRREGSTAKTTSRSLSAWSRRTRRTSSSVSDDLPDPPVPVTPRTGTGRRGGRGAQLVEQRCGQPADLYGGDDPSEGAMVPREQLVDRRDRPVVVHRDRIDVGRFDDGVDHASQAHPLAVLRREDAADAGLLQQGDLVGHDHATPATEDAHVAAAPAAQLVDQVAEVLDVAALVRGHRHGLRVLLDDGREHLLHRAVVAQVDHLATL